jgi:type IV secretory pathway VirB10-like protein
MFGLKEYINDNESVASIETYYSQEAVSDEVIEDEEDMGEYYDEYENYDMNEVPYKTKPVEKEVPKVAWKPKIPEVNPWSAMDLGENITKSLTQIMEEEKNKEEMLKKKQEENEKKKSKFKRTKNFNFKNNKPNNGSLLLGIKKMKKNI